MISITDRCGVSRPRHAARIALGLALVFAAALSTASAAEAPGLTDVRSPLISLPVFRAEANCSMAWMSLTSGKLSQGEGQKWWNLRDDLGMNSTVFLLGCMARFQAGRFSARVNYEERSFVGTGPAGGDPLAGDGEARLEYSGLRLGGDVDIVQWNLSRFGINADFDLFSPEFVDGIRTPGGLRMIGRRATTLGIHGLYNPVVNYWGVSPIFEVRARWPLSGTEITDVELSAGVRTPETVFGSMAWKSGYRHTAIEFSDRRRSFDALLDGWFSELVYYY
jgi:hypothetical protein